MADAQTDTETRPFVLDRSKLYHQVNAGTNRQQATNLRAPALTWHRAFWLQPRYTGVEIQDEDFLEHNRHRKKATIDNIIMSAWSFIYAESCVKDSAFNPPVECQPKIIRASETDKTQKMDVYLLFSSAVTTEISNSKLEFSPIAIKNLTQREDEIFNSDNRVVTLTFHLHRITITLRVELHSEYFNLTLYAELANDVLLDELKNKKLNSLAAYFGDPLKEGESLNNFLFHTFWREDFLDSFLTDPNLKQKLHSKIFDGVFADSRGLIISDRSYKVKSTWWPWKIKKLDWADQIEKQCLKLFARHDEYECTASYLLDGRAAYFTTLAPQFTEVSSDKLLPLEYVLYVHQESNFAGVGSRVNVWQLGRLVDRIHLLDTLRLAALTYSPALRKAGATLSQLDSHINYARETIDPKKAQRPIDRQQKEQVDNAINDVHSTFGRITKVFNESNSHKQWYFVQN